MVIILNCLVVIWRDPGLIGLTQVLIFTSLWKETEAQQLSRNELHHYQQNANFLSDLSRNISFFKQKFNSLRKPFLLNSRRAGEVAHSSPTTSGSSCDVRLKLHEWNSLTRDSVTSVATWLSKKIKTIAIIELFKTRRLPCKI